MPFVKYYGTPATGAVASIIWEHRKEEKWMSNIEKRFIVFVILLFVITASWILIAGSFFSDISVENNKTKQMMKTDLGDEFLFIYDYSNFPDSQTKITILDKKSNIKIDCFYVEDKIDKIEVINIINTINIRCYEVYDNLLYKVNNDEFTLVEINQINKMNPLEYPSLEKVCNILVGQHEWKWIKVSANFLIKSDNRAMIKLLQNYTKGEFAKEEMELNRDSGITKEEIQSFSKAILEN